MNFRITPATDWQNCSNWRSEARSWSWDGSPTTRQAGRSRRKACSRGNVSTTTTKTSVWLASTRGSSPSLSRSLTETRSPGFCYVQNQLPKSSLLPKFVAPKSFLVWGSTYCHWLLCNKKLRFSKLTYDDDRTVHTEKLFEGIYCSIDLSQPHPSP